MTAKNNCLRRMLEKNAWEEYLETLLRALLRTLVVDSSQRHYCQQPFKNHLLKIDVNNISWNECFGQFFEIAANDCCWQWLLEMFLRRVIEEMWFRGFLEMLLSTIIQKSSSENHCQEYLKRILSEMNALESS